MLLQLIAAGLAVRLVWRTHALWAWVPVALILIVLTGRRAVTVWGMRTGQVEVDLSAELVALVISLSLVAGVGLIGHTFERMRRNSEELRIRQRELKSLIDLTPEGIALVSRDLWRYVNPSFFRFLGFSSSEGVEGTSVRARLEPEDEHVFTEFLAWINPSQSSDGEPAIRELRIRHEGGVATLETTRGPVISYGGEQARLLLIRDVSSHKLLEAQLMEATRMEAVGRVAGGMAHDFNNLLTVILASAELAREQIAAKALSVELIDAIEVSAERGARLTQQLLSFAQCQRTSPALVDLNQLIVGEVSLVASLLGEAVTLRLNLSPEPVWVSADRAQLEKVLVNLAMNSRDAMVQGGVLEIATRAALCDPATLPASRLTKRLSDSEPLKMQVLEIRDTGMGMSEEIQRHIFEPFFTTKPQGSGTGLGLSMCQGVVSQAGGQIQVESTLHYGTTVRILLPPCEAETTVRRPPDLEASERGTEKVLVVEDEALLRDITSRTLRRAGYEVTVCQDGVEGLSALEAAEGQFDVMVSDIVMPRMNGCELAAYVCAHHPNVRILLVSGYGEKALADVGIPDDSALLPKPFTPRSLCRAVRRVLDGPLLDDASIPDAAATGVDRSPE